MTDELPGIIERGRDLIGALYAYGFPISETAVAALERKDNAEVKALHEATVAFIAAIDGLAGVE